MKQGWEIKKLGEVAHISPSKSEVKTFALNPMDMVSFLPMEDLTIGRTFVHPNKQKTLSEVEGSYTYFKEGDVLLAKVTPCFENGKLAIAKGLCNNIGFGSSEYIVIRPMQHIVNSQYLIYLLQTNAFRNGGRTLMIGACGLKRLPKPYVANYELPVPSLAEQERIVEILDREFERIDALKANAEQNLQHAKDLFQSALKQELQPKEGWITMQIGNVCELKQGLAINAKTKYLLVEKSQLPLLRIKDLKDGTREIFVNESECPQGCRAYPEDIIYTRTGTLGLVFTGAYGVMHNNCFKIEIDKEKIDKYYLMYYLQQDSFRNNIIKLASRAAQPDITHKLFKEQIIHFPTIAEQVAIIHKLSDIREHCTALEENYKKTIVLCDDMKQALLRKAFNGEL